MADGMDKPAQRRADRDRSCPRCKAAGLTASQCAFLRGTFSDDNWNCATMNALRALADCAENQNEILGVVHCAAGYVVMAWCGNRGRTAVAHVVTRTGIIPLTDAVIASCFPYQVPA
jgi:hypothetical protein